MRRFRDFSVVVFLGASLAFAATGARSSAAAEAAEDWAPRSSILADATVVTDPATGNPTLVVPAQPVAIPKTARAVDRARSVLRDNARPLGIGNPDRELEWLGDHRDSIGGEQAVFRQIYRGLPVFGTMVRVHFNSEGALTAINGTLVSEIDLDPVPRVDAHDAEAAAGRIVAKASGRDVATLDIQRAALMVYRENLVRGQPGANHLAWEIEVVSPPDLHEVLYLDAHDGRLLDLRSEVHHLDRVIHVGRNPNPIWSEGDTRPYSSGNSSRDDEVNELIDATGDTHTLFSNITGGSYLSFDGLDATMNAVYDSDSIDCPNAVESGGVTAFCEDMVSDDVVAHEWAHAYTGWTHGLIYQWQPGALNEAYSDIYGELVDLLNGRGTDAPGGLRTPGGCSNAGGSPQPTLDVLGPPSAAGSYPAGGAVFNPVEPWTITATVVAVDDGVGVPSDGCEPLDELQPGAIALIDRGLCLFRDKVVNAQTAGAAGVIVVNNQGDEILEMGGDLPRLAIPAVFIGQSDGDRIKAALGDGVTAVLKLDGEFNESVRWIIGEDTRALGPIRDMWSPSCFGDPPQVTSVNYACSELDNGGVHTNSGIPNHAFALLVDGGSFNGRQIGAIGATKAARIYWRAMSRYQTPVTGFPAHADLLETSCRDLVGQTLYDLETGNPSPEVITSEDCSQVATAMEAVEMRVHPDQCRFDRLLDPDAPPVTGNTVVFEETFESDPSGSWQLANRGVFPEYEARDWEWTDALPEGGEGSAFFAIDSVLIGDCVPGSDDQSGVMELTGPPIDIPPRSLAPVLSFDHWVATEPRWDGGNVKISVNGGPFVAVPYSRYVFNPPTGRIESGNSNPLKGQWAFTGTDGGTLSGSWGQSQIDLDGLVSPGDRISLRFDFGVDGCNGAVGWYIDNIRLIATSLAPRQSGGRVRP
ncbi:MAG: M4 family metallopeptidase [Candidatus Sulfomarinibacteraceae bacterium]